jgi:NADPH:quinone reductase-like Zn-dependent oxidoreductase
MSLLTSESATMRAVAFDRHGGPEVLTSVEVERPRPAEGEVLVRVHACGLNHGLDGRTRQNGAGRQIQFPHILGTDIVGEIVEIGDDVDPGHVGRHAVVMPWRACGSCVACQEGRIDQCAARKLRGVDLPGGYAEYITARQSELILLPSVLSRPAFEAAALPVSYTTAWHMIMRRANLKSGETVLVLGAAGTVGIAATQIATSIGAHVIAAASSEEKLRLAQSMGAEVLINYSSQNIAREVKEATGGRGVDVVIEHIGAATWEASLDSLATYGRLAMCGATTGWNLAFDARRLWRKDITLNFCNSGTPQDLRAVVDHWCAGTLRPIIGMTFPLSEARQAHEALGDRNLIGKILLIIDKNSRPGSNV